MSGFKCGAELLDVQSNSYHIKNIFENVHLGNGISQGCTNLDLVKCSAKFVKSIGSDVFQGCDALECVVAPNCKMSDFGGKPITSSDPDEEEEGSDSDDALSLELSD